MVRTQYFSAQGPVTHPQDAVDKAMLLRDAFFQQFSVGIQEEHISVIAAGPQREILVATITVRYVRY